MPDQRFNPWLHRYYQRFSADGGSDKLDSVVFLLGSPDISGGTYVIFQHAMWLEEHGVDVTIIPLFPKDVAADDWHPALSKLNFSTFDEVKNHRFDVAVATWWPTVYELPRLRFRHPVYFVQSMEPRLEVDHDASQAGLAELTYTFGIPTITIALWMQAYLAFQHQAPSFLVRNGIDKSVFTSDGPAISPRPTDHMRILVEGPVDSAMKGVEDAVKVARDAGCEDIWLLTSSDVADNPGCSRVFSRVPLEATPEIYRSCDVLLKMSNVEGMYGPPLEMFHCGGTVVTNDVTGHEEFIVNGMNALVVDLNDPDAAVRALQTLQEDRSLLDKLRKGAEETAGEWPAWDVSSREFGHTLATVAQQPAEDLSSLCRELMGAFPLDELVQSQGRGS